MSDIVEDYRFLREYYKERRDYNLKNSTNLLEELGVNFESKNNGYHLIIRNGDLVCDFYPSTGKYKLRGDDYKFKRGVKKMLTDMKLLKTRGH